MILAVLSDASYLSRPRARSETGSYHPLSRVPLSGLPGDAPAFINGPLSCHSNVIPVVCSSVQEAEYAGLFAAARLADEERRILHNLGYPQPLTLLLCDNECAVGLASKTMTPSLSKSIDCGFTGSRIGSSGDSSGCSISRAMSTSQISSPRPCLVSSTINSPRTVLSIPPISATALLL